MTAPPIDQFLLDHAPASPLPIQPELIDARRSIVAALGDLAAIPDSALERPWPWRGDDADVRYGFYRQYEALEEARSAVRRGLAVGNALEPPARPILGAATAARWELHGVLAGLPDDVLDRDPGGGEWTVRQTLAHIVGGQRAYGWFTAWWHSRRDLPPDDFPAREPEDLAALLPDESTEAPGALADIRVRVDDALDLGAAVFAGIGDEGLVARARWSGYPVDVRFRLHRWASHMREHTVQVDKTLAMLGRPTTEVERLVRLVAAAYGRLEEDLFMWPPGHEALSEQAALAERSVAALAAAARSVREAATA